MATYQKKAKANPTSQSMKTIKEHIEGRTFSKVYLLFGEETYLVNQYRDMLVSALVNDGDTMNFTSYTADSYNLNSVAGDIVTMPFLAEYRVVLVEDSGIFDKSDDSLLESIDQMGEENILIFCEKKVDKRKKLYTSLNKNEKASCLEFATPDISTLTKWLSGILSEGGLKVKVTVPDRLITAAGSDMNTLRNEASKLHDYCMERGEITDEDVSEVCVNPVEDKIFDMCEAISKKDSAKALSLYNDLCILKTSPMSVIYLISRQYNQLLQVGQLLSEKKSPSEIASFLKTPEFAARKYISICSRYSVKDLATALDRCQEADLSVKTGKLIDVNSAENLIVNLLAG
ncbi:MAG: DNA polymerase III subunit delta [Eubacterium sp.]|nr:DNA polymerase III subunit delta [Eubacterium sp.]